MSQITKGRVSRSLKGNVATLRKENGNADVGNVRDNNAEKRDYDLLGSGMASVGQTGESLWYKQTCDRISRILNKDESVIHLLSQDRKFLKLSLDNFHEVSRKLGKGRKSSLSYCRLFKNEEATLVTHVFCSSGARIH